MVLFFSHSIFFLCVICSPELNFAVVTFLIRIIKKKKKKKEKKKRLTTAPTRLEFV